jgi:hypothetical protein
LTGQVWWRPNKSDQEPLEASLEILEAGHSTGLVRWGSLEVGQSSLDVGHRSDRSGPPDKSDGGTGQVWSIGGT